MKNHEKKESIKNKKPSLKERFLKKSNENPVSAVEYEAKMREAKNSNKGIPCALR